MKKIFTLILCLTFVSMTFAQEKKLSYGVKANFNLSTLMGKDVDGLSMKPGFSAGILAEYRFSNLIAVAPELLYSLQGAKAKGDGEKATLNAQYINLPIMVKFYVLPKLSIDLGPQFGYAVSMKMKMSDVSVKVPTETYNAFDLSIGAGATYNFCKLFASARYNFGLTNVIKNGANKTSVLQIGVGYKF